MSVSVRALSALSVGAALFLAAGCGGSSPTPMPAQPALGARSGHTAFATHPATGTITAPIYLASARTYAVMAGSTVTNTGNTVINGDLGLSPGTAVTGFPPGIINGHTHVADAPALKAQTDLTKAYNDAAGRPGGTALPADIGGMVLAPGVYTAPVSLGITGTVTLDAQNNPKSIFIFQIPSTLITAVGSSVKMINGALACNVYWQVGSSATLNTSSDFRGTIMAYSSISVGAGSNIHGRLLARTAAVTLIDDTINRTPYCECKIGGPTV